MLLAGISGVAASATDISRAGRRAAGDVPRRIPGEGRRPIFRPADSGSWRPTRSAVGTIRPSASARA